MNQETIKLITEKLNLLPFVKWDRYTDAMEKDHSITIFGWIDRLNDCYKDFVALTYWADTHEIYRGFSFHTSSALHSEEISRLLNGSDEVSERHIDCKRVENTFTKTRNTASIKLN